MSDADDDGPGRDAPGRPKQAAIPSGDWLAYPADQGQTASPCINVCHMHAQTGWCEGCARNIDEIIIWGRADEATKRAVLAQLPERREQLRELGVWIPDV